MKVVDKLFCRWKYLPMQGKISAGNNSLPFPQVTGGNSHVAASNLREAFIVSVSADFFNPMDFSFYPEQNNLTKGTTCRLWGHG